MAILVIAEEPVRPIFPYPAPHIVFNIVTISVLAVTRHGSPPGENPIDSTPLVSAYRLLVPETLSNSSRIWSVSSEKPSPNSA